MCKQISNVDRVKYPLEIIKYDYQTLAEKSALYIYIYMCV